MLCYDHVSFPDPIFHCQGHCPGHTGGHNGYRYVLGLGLGRHFVRDIVQVIHVTRNGYRYVLGLGLEPDNVLDKLYDDPLYGTLE